MSSASKSAMKGDWRLRIVTWKKILVKDAPRDTLILAMDHISHELSNSYEILLFIFNQIVITKKGMKDYPSTIWDSQLRPTSHQRSTKMPKSN